VIAAPSTGSDGRLIAGRFVLGYPVRRWHSIVMAGLDPAIHPLRKGLFRRLMDTRVKPAYDEL
jgi:hypothetical protein